MKTIATIISDNKVKNIPEYVLLTKNKDINDITLPTLVIGYEISKKLIPNFNILEKNPQKNLFWTFKRTEKRNDYERDLEEFYKFIIKKYINDCDYRYVNVLKLKFRDLYRFFKQILPNSYIYTTNNMIYLSKSNVVYGFNKEIIEYTGFNLKKCLNFIENSKIVHIINNDEEILNKNIFINLNECYIPYFYSKITDK